MNEWTERAKNGQVEPVFFGPFYGPIEPISTRNTLILLNIWRTLAPPLHEKPPSGVVFFRPQSLVSFRVRPKRANSGHLRTKQDGPRDGPQKMPRIARELGPLEVSRLKKNGEHPVGGVPGLYLRVEGGSRAWLLRYTIDSKRRRMGLGPFPAVPLAAARERARKERALLDLGHDPIAERAASRERQSQKRAMTFSTAMERCIASKSAEWSNAKHQQQWTNTLTTYAVPILGEMSVADITTDHVLKVLEPIWKTKTETATRVRQRIETVLDWATVLKKRSGDNPARWSGHLEVLLPKPSKVATVKHHEAVPYSQAPDAYTKIAATSGNGGRALLFQILTATRSGETRGAAWSEIDLERAEWVIPSERMKGRREHRVPLSTQAIILLKAQPRIAGVDLVFPALRGKPLSDMTLSAVMRRLGLPGVPHGFRSSFKDWATEVAHAPNELSEMALAHTIANKVEAAYRRGDLFERRATLMQQWADFIAPTSND